MTPTTPPPARTISPASLAELIHAVRGAEAGAARVKALGADRSFSDVAHTTGTRIRTDRLDRPLPVDPATLRDPAAAATLVRVEAGMRLFRLNRLLDRRGLALENTPAFTGQTVAGAVATASHGTGLGLGPLCDLVVSIELVASGGACWRIEPRDGITDPARFRTLGVRLVQDDDWFYSVVASLGCMGVAYALTFRTVPRFFLAETRTLLTWPEARADVASATFLRRHRHYGLLVNPHEVGGRRLCVATVRDPAATPPPGWRLRPRQRLAASLAGRLPIARLVVAALNRRPERAPGAIDAALRACAPSRACRPSWQILDNRPLNTACRAHAIELSVPVARAVEATEAVLALADRRRRAGVPLTGPVALRFVRASRHHLSPHFGADACAIEVVSLHGSTAGRDELAQYERLLLALGGRPHWGLDLFDPLAGGGALEAMYPRFPAWRAVYGALNPLGTFDNALTARLGFRPALEGSGPRGAARLAASE